LNPRRDRKKPAELPCAQQDYQKCARAERDGIGRVSYIKIADLADEDIADNQI
jgi:hypothetical protein